MHSDTFHRRLTVLAAYIALLAPFTINQANAKDNKENTSLGTVNVEDSRNKDQAGYAAQYEKDISNVYIGKDQIDHYRGSSPADILKGAIGVYSGDSRNGGALDPNIRGIQGQGRVPVTIDGTEQAITVYRGYNGANNRNYLDPNLISSVEIEKGSALDPNIKTSTGGGIAIKTLGIDDIVPKGDSFGINLRMETRSNSVNPHAPDIPLIGNDYRLDPTYHYYSYDVTGDDVLERPAKTAKDNKFPGFNDNAARIGFGWRKPAVDLLFAYSYRNQGNYFAGKSGAQKYDAPVTNKDAQGLGNNGSATSGDEGLPWGATKGVDPFLPFAARIYKPGNEVPNTSNKMQSVLIKNTWRFNGDQSVQFGFRDTHTQFGDIMPSRLGSIPWVATAGSSMVTRYNYGDNVITQWPLGKVHMLAANMAYKWQPQNNRWLDLNMNLWFTYTNSDTNTGAGYPREPLYRQADYDAWGRDYHKNPALNTPKPDIDPDIDGRLVNTSLTNAKNNRYGIDISNKITLTNSLNLMLMGNFQYETLDSADDRYKMNDNKVSYRLKSTFPQPRKGKRQENSLAFTFNYRPVSWLEFNAGARRVSYWSQDDMLDELVKANVRGEKWASPPEKEAIGKYVDYYRLPTAAEAELLEIGDPYAPVPPLIPFTGTNFAEWLASLSARDTYRNNTIANLKAKGKYDDYMKLVGRRLPYQEGNSIYVVTINDSVERLHYGDIIKVVGTNFSEIIDKDTYYIRERVKIPYVDGKLQKSADPYYTKDFDKKVPSTSIPTTPDAENPTGSLVYQYRRIPTWGGQSGVVYQTREITAPQKRKDHAWAPVFSAAAFLTDDARVYLRYAESVRMPSIFEDTIGFAGFQNIKGYQFKPERAKTAEVGFVYNFKSLLNARRSADFRINYYHTDIDNVFDRDGNFFFVQMDKMKLAGIEAMARYDNGFIFGSAGLDYNLNYKVCDSNQALNYNLDNTQYVPECIDGGFPGGYLRTTIPPRYSLNATLGGRLFDNALEIGTRWLYHSSVVNKDEQKYPYLLQYGINNNPMRWNPVLTVDAYIDYRINKYVQLELSGENLTNQYYLDPLTRSMIPAPGRTVKLAINAQF